MNQLIELRQHLAALRRRRGLARQLAASCAAVSAALAVLLAIYALDVTFELSVTERLMVNAGGLGAFLWCAWRARWMQRVGESTLELAIKVERQHDLSSDLVAALQFEQPEARGWGSTQLRQAVIERARELAQRLDVFVGFSDRPHRRWAVLAGGLAAAAVVVFVLSPAHTSAFFRRLLLGARHYPTRTRLESLAINEQLLAPRWHALKTVTSPRGSDLAFRLACSGVIPSSGRLELISADGEHRSRVVLTPESGSGPRTVFTGQVPRLLESITYQIFVGDAWTDPAAVRVVAPPVVNVKLRVAPPAYARQEAVDTDGSSLHLTVVSGSRVDMQVAGINRPLLDVDCRIAGDSRVYPLRRENRDGLSWVLTGPESPFKQIGRAVEFEIQATDEYGLHPENPLRGAIRIQPDALPRITAAMVHQVVLPAAAPVVEYRAHDDYGLARVQLRLAVSRPGSPPMEHVVTARQAPSGILRDQLPLRDQYAIDLSRFDLRKGDRVQLTPEALDYRGNLPGQWQRGDPLVFDVSDERGVLAAIGAADQESERRLTEIIQHQLGPEKRKAQERARAVARALLADVLDLQLKQLEENGLSERPIYRDICSLHAALDGPIDQEMAAIVQLLVDAEQAAAADRAVKTAAARDAIRDVVSVLVAERQKLRRRLRIAQIGAQVRELIQFQQSVHEATRRLPGLTPRQSAVQAVHTTEDQRDAKTLYLQLVAMLNDVSAWRGEVGLVATQGLRELQVAKVAEELDSALGDLLRLELEKAAAAQWLVIRGLEALLEKVEAAHGNGAGDAPAGLGRDQSADELAAKLRQLDRLNKAMGSVAKVQAGAAAKARDEPSQAEAAQRRVAQWLRQVVGSEGMSSLPAVVTSRLQEALRQAERAGERLSDQGTAAASRVAETEQAATTIERAQAEIASELADLHRRHLAVEIGELARASEALERLAAAEVRIQETAAKAAADENRLGHDAARAMQQQNAETKRAADELASGMALTAPDVQRQLVAVGQRLQGIDQLLDQPEQSADVTTQIAAGAGEAAGLLASAAAQLRAQAQRRAEELSGVAGQQLERVGAARADVQQAASASNPQRARQLDNLLDARGRVQHAMDQQLRAVGRPSAADAARLVRQMRRVLDAQQLADASARDLAAGRADSPLDAAVRQQAVNEMIEQIAAEVPTPLQPLLDAASRSATKAAQQTVDNHPELGDRYRQETRQFLEQARQVADNRSRKAAESPLGKTDPAAQRRVSELSHEASELTASAVPRIAQTLQRAQRQSDAVEKSITLDDLPEKSDLQEQVRQLLHSAEEQLNGEIEQLTRQKAEDAARQIAAAERLAEQISSVDPDAAAALRSAASAEPEYFQRAEESLISRQQQIGRDQAVAQALAAMAGQQQIARDQIVKLADEIAGSAAENAAARPESRPSDPAAAERLARVMRQFAQAQTGTGQGAAEISRQQEVANQSIRAGLEAASQLGSCQICSAPATASHPSEAAETGSGEFESPESATHLGTGFVPTSPQVTAELIAGPAAKYAIQPARGGYPASGDDPHPSQSPRDGQGSAATGQSEMGAGSSSANRPATSASSASSTMPYGSGGAEGNPRLPNPIRPDTHDSSFVADSDGAKSGEESSARIAARKFSDEVWFAKLPPTLRNAIEAKATRPPPRGYEERLRRYFESDER